jgi:hypothetical protein
VSYTPQMLQYRIDFLGDTGDVLAMHEIDYSDDRAAIASAHLINGFPSIGAGFKVWRGDRLVYHHNNGPEFSN